MPIYEYQCTECGNEIEVIQKVGARAPGRCDKCSGKFKKKISRASFQLKGGGWYSDGYGNSGSGTSGSASSPKSEKSDGGKSSKTKKAASA